MNVPTSRMNTSFLPPAHASTQAFERCRDVDGGKKEREIGLSSVKRLPARRTTQHLSMTNQHSRPQLNSTRTTPETWMRKRLTLLLRCIFVL